MNRLCYLYENKLNTKDPKIEDFYEFEKILNKTEEVKFQDSEGNMEYDAKCYFTNLRILVLSNKFIFDVPLIFIKSHYVKKPMLYGSNYIYVELITNNLVSSMPPYLANLNYPGKDNLNNYRLPKYIMIKFRGKESDIDKSYNILKIALNSKDWNNILHVGSIKNKTETKTKIDNIQGLGVERTKNIIMSQIKEQNSIISDSFLDIQNLKDNALQMIELSQKLKTKLSSMTNDSTVNEINQVLASVGFIDPVTKETSGKSYFKDLALQINEYFKNYFQKEGLGIISLIDAYCMYNRSRGMSTISPGDMKIALDYFKTFETTLQVKTYNNEMIMLQTEDYSLKNIIKKLKIKLGEDKEFITLKEFTQFTKTQNQLLSKILLDEMLKDGLLVLDESDFELRYYINKFLPS